MSEIQFVDGKFTPVVAHYRNIGSDIGMTRNNEKLNKILKKLYLKLEYLEFILREADREYEKNKKDEYLEEINRKEYNRILNMHSRLQIKINYIKSWQWNLFQKEMRNKLIKIKMTDKKLIYIIEFFEELKNKANGKSVIVKVKEANRILYKIFKLKANEDFKFLNLGNYVLISLIHNYCKIFRYRYDLTQESISLSFIKRKKKKKVKKSWWW